VTVVASSPSAPPFGVSQYTTWPQSFEQDLTLFQALGVENIEVCEAKLDAGNPRPQLERLKASGLKVTSVQPRLHSLFPDQPRPEPASPGERMKLLADSIELFGQYFPGATLVSISGAAPGGDYHEAYKTAAREYRELAKIAEGHGVRVALEPLNPILMNVDTFICSLAQARRVIEAVDHPAFGMFVDVWHIWEDESACQLIAQTGSRIFGVHINDWNTPRAFGDRYIPGEGQIPLAKLLKAIRDSGYQGAYTLEIFSELRLGGSLWADPQKTVTQSKIAFENIWNQICA
jgi:sugar phosphate isomerase/epimerase